MTDNPIPPAPPAKVDPETLAIRARPPRAIRFRRGVIIGGTAAGAFCLMAVAWVALQPQVFRQVVQESELSQPTLQPAGDALGNLPTNYGEVPKLGPPLPGDLGRPILRAQQRAMASEGNDADRAERADAERRAAELKAARESGLIAQSGRAMGDAARAPQDDPPPANAPAPAAVAGPISDRKGQFVADIDQGDDVNPHRLVQPTSPNMLMTGSVIAASLITGINSDLPGTVTAQVTQNVFDTASGTILLVPQGARLIGRYDSVIAFGQRRALIVWQRLILPNGSSIRLDNMPATDGAGYAGLADKVDFHTWTLLKGVAIATLLGVGSELSISGESDLVQAIRESAQSNTARAGDRITQRNLDIQPTITIRPGAPVRLLVTRDLILAPWRAQAG